MAFFGVNSTSQDELSREQNEVVLGGKREVRTERAEEARAGGGRKQEGKRGLEDALVIKH